MKALAFQEKRPCGCMPCVNGPSVSQVSDELKAYREYARNHPQKLKHCRVVRDAEGKVVGGIQLQLPGDIGDLTFDDTPGSDFHHKPQPDEVYLEWICVHPAASGKGIGSKLLAWGHNFAKESGARFISLNVMGANQGAKRLYERKGYVAKTDPHEDSCSRLLTPCIVFCFMGCRYCKLVYMEKPLVSESEQEP